MVPRRLHQFTNMANDSDATSHPIRQKLIDFWNDWYSLQWMTSISLNDDNKKIIKLLLTWIERIENMQRLLSRDKWWMYWYTVERGLNHFNSITTAKANAEWTGEQFDAFRYLSCCSIRKQPHLTRTITDAILDDQLTVPTVLDFWLATLELTHVLPPTILEFDRLSGRTIHDSDWELIVSGFHYDIYWYFL